MTTAPSSNSSSERYHDHTVKYRARSAELPRELRERFRQLALDDETRRFIDDAPRSRHGRLTTALHALLRPFWSDFDINGWLGTYPLFLLSREQWATLLASRTGGRLLDVGAGLGEVTARIGAEFDQIVATETSPPLARRLARRGIECHLLDITESEVPAPPYDAVSVLNVVDRCDRPRILLERSFEALRPGGLLILATPLPYDPMVYDGGRTRDPEQPLRASGRSWEHSLGRLYHNEVAPLGGELLSVSRAPYLSVGDAARALYVLDDAILIVRKAT